MAEILLGFWVLFYIIVAGILMWQAFSNNTYGYNKHGTIWVNLDSNEKLVIVIFWPIVACVMVVKGAKTLIFGKKVSDE